MNNGTFQGIELTFGSFGQQYTTIDGQKYITFLDLTDPNLQGLKPGAEVEFEAIAGPTVLCSCPHINVDLPSATLLKVVKPSGHIMDIKICYGCGDKCETGGFTRDGRGHIYCDPCYAETPEGEKDWEEAWEGEGEGEGD